MTTAKLPILAGLALAALGLPAAAQDVPEEILAERRLRACLMGGSAGAPKIGLVAAVVAVRSLCRSQIERVREERHRAVDERFGLPDSPLTATRQAEAAKARATADRLLDDQIVVAVSNFTGLTQ